MLPRQQRERFCNYERRNRKPADRWKPSAPDRRRRPHAAVSGAAMTPTARPRPCNESDGTISNGPARPDVLEEDAAQESQRRRRRRDIGCHGERQTDLPRTDRARRSARTASSRARTGIRRRHHRDFRQRLWFSARREAQFRPDTAGYFCHAGNRAALSACATACGFTAKPAAAIAARN